MTENVQVLINVNTPPYFVNKIHLKLICLTTTFVAVCFVVSMIIY